jgi:hypothetical protein
MQESETMIKPMLCALIVIPAVTLMSAQAQALSLCCVPAVPRCRSGSGWILKVA